MSAGEAAGKRAWLRGTVRLALITVAILVIAAVSGAAFNYFTVRHYRSLYPAPGQTYRVDGYKMHLYCIGSGTPTIVLDSGLGDDFLIWGRVQPDLARVTRVCSYDRAGLGWSENRPGLRDSNTIADQLHMLLQQAGISEPTVLMGHSLGGLNVRAYASRFPQEIVGLVLVDSSVPEQLAQLSRSVLEFHSHFYRVELKWMQWKTAFGIQRVFGRCGQTPAGYEAYSGLIKADDCIPFELATIKREFDSFERSCGEVEHTGPFPSLPILIFSEDPNNQQPDNPANISADFSLSWNSLQESLKRLSPRSRRVIAKGSSHYIQSERPELLIKEVTQLILQIRGTASQPSNYGSTVTE
jgi:pimeloyl-ACP methyl ester carboxylesterase